MSESRINILLLQSMFHLGGAEKITHEIFTRMDNESFHTVVCTLYEPGPMGEPFKKSGFPFYSNLISGKYDLSAFFRLNRIVKNHSIDIIYLINQPLTIFWGYVIGKYKKIPVISVVHNTPVLSEHKKLNVYKWLLPNVAKVITVSEMQKKHLAENEGISTENVEVVHNGIDFIPYMRPENREDVLHEFTINENKKIIGIVTRLVSLKGIDVFLRSAAHILKKTKNVHFLIIGDGPERWNLENLARDLGIDKNVSFLGVRHDVKKLISVFDVAVLSSRTEALPIVLLEYLSSSKPVVSTDVGSISEVLVDGENGYLVDVEDKETLAEKILVLLRDKEMSNSFGQAGLKTIKTRFSIETTVCKTQAIIRSAVTERKRRGYENGAA